MLTNLQKHARYKHSYGRNELYWGLGIEEETYLQFDKPIHVAAPIIRLNHKAERYSVRYFDNYKHCYRDILNQMFPDASGCIPLPLYLNSHVFLKCDPQGNHKTTYEKVPQTNPLFTGKTIHELLLQNSKELLDGFDTWYCFDGDTLEFMTQNFYKANVKEVIQELLRLKRVFLEEVQTIFQRNKIHREKGLLIYPPRNPGLVVHLTNPNNVCVFNNGTYHINLTLPSWLNAKGELLYPDLFREQHRAFARLIQWIEPLLLLEYGTPDFLSCKSQQFSAVSQRGAMSRYIGIGTFDTVEMPAGKRNTIPVEEISRSEFWWYTNYHKESGYQELKEIGMDLNFKKHHNHGLELRLMDWFPEYMLAGFLRKLLLLAQASQQLPLAAPPIQMESWNTCVKGVLVEGSAYKPSLEVLAAYEKVFHIPVLELSGIQELQETLWKQMELLYGKGSVLKTFGL